MNVNYPNGFVVLPVGEYNKMKEVIEVQQQVLDNLVVSVEPAYNGERLDVTLNADAIYPLAVCKFEENADLVKNYNLVDRKEFRVWGVDFATLKPVSEMIEGE